MCWVEEERARGKGCVKRMKTALCASEPGAWGAPWPAGPAGRHSFREGPWSSRSESGPAVGADPPGGDPAFAGTSRDGRAVLGKAGSAAAGAVRSRARFLSGDVCARAPVCWTGEGVLSVEGGRIFVVFI